MDIREIEEMRKLQRKYYAELRKAPRLDYYSVHKKFLYRIVLIHLLAFSIVCFFTHN